MPEKILGKQHLYVQVSGEPMVASTDQLIELLYDLTASEAGALDAYSYEGERELVFALGEHEIRATLGEGQQLQFDNDSLEHLAALDLTPEDYLMIRLYSNNDAGNILWEWAFSYLAGAPEEGEVNADEPTLELIVYATGVEDENVEMTWSVEGPGGSMASRSTASEIGIFTNTLHTSRTRDDIYFVTARVTSSEADE